MKEKDYKKIWDMVILPQINKYENNEYALVRNPEAKQLIFNYYVEFRDYCKAHYMLDANNFIDRHKICACMMYAIVKAQPLHLDTENDNTQYFPTFNEKIAITTGLSLLRAFVISSAKQNLKDSECNEIIEKFKSGIKVPRYPFINHGDYIENFVVELYFSREKENYNILSLAHTLYMLELYNRIR